MHQSEVSCLWPPLTDVEAGKEGGDEVNAGGIHQSHVVARVHLQLVRQEEGDALGAAMQLQRADAAEVVALGWEEVREGEGVGGGEGGKTRGER